MLNKKLSFITFEGGEGSGKTTIILLVKEFLENLGYQVIVTREPGGVKIAEQIRQVILDKSNTEMDYKTEMLLYAAARREHLVHKVKRYIEEGYVVLCDRFVDSSLVYQGYARGLGFDEVWKVNELVIGDTIPDVTFYLDVDPLIGLDRINKNDGREVNRLDLESLEFHQNVRKGYKELLKRFNDRIIEINANQSIDSVKNQLFDKLGVLFKGV